MNAADYAKLLHTLTEWDRRQQNRKGYNRYALAHYAGALGRVRQRVEAGQPLRESILTEFLGELANKLVRSVGLPAMSKYELKWGCEHRLPPLPESDEID